MADILVRCYLMDSVATVAVPADEFRKVSHLAYLNRGTGEWFAVAGVADMLARTANAPVVARRTAYEFGDDSDRLIAHGDIVAFRASNR